MYRIKRQLEFDYFSFPLGQLNPDNDWLKLAQMVPWDDIEEYYSAQFVNKGHPAYPARLAFGALLIKKRLNCSDAWTVRHISENPYLQFFLGIKEYQVVCPFRASTMVAFRKRFPPQMMAEVNKELRKALQEEDQKKSDKDVLRGN